MPSYPAPTVLRDIKEKQDAYHAPEDLNLADEAEVETGKLHNSVIRQSDYIIVFKWFYNSNVF